MNSQTELFYGFASGIESIRGKKTFSERVTFESMLGYPNEAVRIQYAPGIFSSLSCQSDGSLLLTNNGTTTGRLLLGNNSVVGTTCLLTGDSTGLYVTGATSVLLSNTIFNASPTINRGAFVTAGVNIATQTSDTSAVFAGATIVSAAFQIGPSNVSTGVAGVNDSYAQCIIAGSPSGVTTAASGTHALACSLAVNFSTYVINTATITNAATVYISGASSGATTNYAVWSDAGVNKFDGVMRFGATVSSAATLTLDNSSTFYIFSGTTTTWTLPTLASSPNWMFRIKNRGSGAITLNSSAGGNDIYSTLAVSSLTINAGGSYILVNDGTYFVTG